MAAFPRAALQGRPLPLDEVAPCCPWCRLTDNLFCVVVFLVLLVLGVFLALPLTAFSGTIVYNYDDTIINDINSASTALFIYDDMTSTWSEYADQDNEDYTVTYNFDGSVPMSKLTAGGLGTLAIDENYSYGIGVYPNPVSSTLNITGLENSTSYLYNSIGQLVLSSNMSTIDLNSFDRGAYILVVEDENKNQTNFKILKK